MSMQIKGLAVIITNRETNWTKTEHIALAFSAAASFDSKMSNKLIRVHLV